MNRFELTHDEKQMAAEMYEGLRRQSWKRCMKNNMCSYRGDDGTRCAIGHVLTDEEVQMAGSNGIGMLFDRGKQPARFVNEDFWVRAQIIHDEREKNMKVHFDMLFERYGLPIPEEA